MRNYDANTCRTVAGICRLGPRLALLAAAWCLIAPGARGDGAFVWRRGADLNEPSQKAILYWSKGKEVMLLQVKYEGAAEEFAWIVPTPARPKVTAIPDAESPFGEISLYTQKRARWGSRTDSKAPAVEVLERKTVGVYDIAVLAAGDPDALGRWLDSNGYAFPTDRREVLAHYTSKHWYYVAMRIDRDLLGTASIGKLVKGELQPLRFEFSTANMVYPLEISSVNAGETEILLYVLADVPLIVDNLAHRKGFAITRNVPIDSRYDEPAYGTYRKTAGAELPLTWKALGVSSETKLSLCKYRSVFLPEDMTEDLVFAPFDPMSFWKRLFADSTTRSDMKMRAALMLVRLDAGTAPRLARDHDAHVRAAVASVCGSGTPDETLQTLAEDHSSEVRLALAANPRVPPRILALLAVDENHWVRKNLAGNPGTPLGTLRRLAADDTRSVREAVVWNERTPPKLLAQLAEDQDASVRKAVVRNPATPAWILNPAVNDQSAVVRSWLAGNPSVAVEVLRQLADDPDNSVRWQLIHNPALPEEILEKLTRDADPKIAQRAREKLRKRRE